MSISLLKLVGAPAFAAVLLAGCGGSEEETPVEEAPAVEENNMDTEMQETDMMEEDTNMMEEDTNMMEEDTNMEDSTEPVEEELESGQ